METKDLINDILFDFKTGHKTIEETNSQLYKLLNVGKLARNKKAIYLRMALALQSIAITDEVADRLVQTYEKVLELKGEFRVSDAADLQVALDKYHKPKQKK